MFYNVNLLAIVVASLGVVGLGWVWYHPKVLGNLYKKLTVSENQEIVEMTKQHMQKGVAVMFISGLLQSSALYFFIVLSRAGSFPQLMTIVFLVWAGFYLSTIVSEKTWMKISHKVMLIDAGYYLLSNIIVVLLLLLVL